jgi:multimeric flavodoxin WrbA
MKVLLVNGSPHAKGATFNALSEVAKSLNAQGIATEFFQVGAQAIAGCTGCQYCFTHGQCVFKDVVNNFADLAGDYDGYVFGTPTHYAAASGAITSFMDRVFFSAGQKLQDKPAAAVIVCRRGGASAAFDQLNKYFTINSMPIVSSTYWNSVHALVPAETAQDLEGLQVMRNLGTNMAWLLKCIEAGKKAGIEMPKREEPVMTNFVR